LSRKDSKTIGRTMEETKEYHERYLRAVNNPLRRDILRALKDGDATLKTLESITGLDAKTLDWHMSILEHGFCVEREDEGGKTLYRLTQEGKVVDYVDKE
jgi:DNA-binding transcriptional ArsR family regulator